MIGSTALGTLTINAGNVTDTAAASITTGDDSAITITPGGTSVEIDLIEDL